VRYTDWISNVVFVIMKNGKMCVCIDFRDLNSATPKDEYPMSVAHTLIDLSTTNEILSLLDGYSSCNQIYIVEQDISKSNFSLSRCLGHL